MKRLLNTLYVTTANSYLSLDGENIVVQRDGRDCGRVPLHNLSGVVCFGYMGASPALMGACAQRGVDLCFVSPGGRFLARVQGPVTGNVALRQSQTLTACDRDKALQIAKLFLGAKLYNARWSLERTARDHPLRIDAAQFAKAIETHKAALAAVPSQRSNDDLMGQEGIAAKAYFTVFPQMILRNGDVFTFHGRSRRPPLDRVNALLSFAYTLLAKECAAVLESVGLDPYIGFLHQLRPGRASLALDLMEELRPVMADRFVLTLINLGQIKGDDFEVRENGAYYLVEEARKTFLAAWQTKKQEMIEHPFLKEKLQWGMVPYAQAMLLSRFLRGDLDCYVPFLWK